MRKFRLKIILASLGLFLALLSTLPHLSYAQSDTGALNLTTSPLPISLVAKPGEIVKTELRVRNSGLKTESLKVSLMKFTAYGEEGKPELKDREVGDDYFDWVHFSDTQFLAQPNEWKSITMTVTVPKSAAFGYYYAVTFSRANSNVTSEDHTATVQGGSATLVLLEVFSPNARRELKLTDFRVDKKSYEFLPANFLIKLANTGNVHSAPVGTIFIMKGGKQIDTITVNVAKGNILPNSGRIFTSQWQAGFPVYEPKVVNGSVVLKNGLPVYALSWKLSQLKNIRFGKYTAHLTIIYDDGHRDVPLDASVDFWVIPWRLLAVFVGVPLLAAGIIVYLVISRRRFKKKAYGVVKFKR